MKYFKVWKQLSNCAISSYLSNRIDTFSYFLGKIIRFSFFLVFIFSIFKYTDSIAGYYKYEVVLFFLTFNLIDIFSQAFFRGIYLFRDDVRQGSFDFILTKPINSLFYSMSRFTDVIDMMFLAPILALIVYTVNRLNLGFDFYNIFAYLVLIMSGVIIVLSVHIISASITIWTTESENVIWFYRELMTIGRFPPEIYSSFIQIVFTFIMPVVVIVAFPAKALLGILAWQWLVFAIVYSFFFFSFSLLLWKLSIKKYSSASS